MYLVTKTLLSRRAFLPLASMGGFSAVLAPRAALAGSFPNRTINFIIPSAAGGGFDAYGREFAELLQQRLHVGVEPINEPGAGGAKAIFGLYNDVPDGYSISIVGIPGGLLHKPTAAFDINRLTWLANLGRDSFGLAVSAKSGLQTIADLRALAAKRPIAFSADGPGSTGYFINRIFTAALGLESKIVTGFKGSGSSLLAVTRGDVDATVQSLDTIRRMQKGGFVRLIFAFEDKSSIPGVEDAAAVNQEDFGKLFQWRTVTAPPGLSEATAQILSSALVEAAQSKAAQGWAKKTHTNLYPLNRQQTVQMIQEQEALVKKWKHVL